MQNTDSFKALLERCGDALACRLVVSCACIAPDEYAGIVLGYIGEGHTRMEPFHASFSQERATSLIIGDLNALTKKTQLFNMHHQPLRNAVVRCAEQLMHYCSDSTEGFWQLCRADALALQWLKSDPDCALAALGTLDERVWTHISAHLGVPVGLEA